MKVNSFFICLIAVASAIIASCKKDKNIEAPLDLGYNYYPTTTGKWVAYDVDSIVYDDFKKTIDTFHFQVKEVIESHFLDNSGRETERIERFHRKSDNEPWQLRDVWSSNRTATSAEKVEEDQRYVKLSFPLKKGRKWNGNAFNSFEEEEYKLENFDQPLKIGTLEFDSTLSVLQVADSNFIEKKFVKEIYAKNIGLIYKKYIHVSDNDGSINGDLESRITTGVKYYYTINSFGN